MRTGAVWGLVLVTGCATLLGFEDVEVGQAGSDAGVQPGQFTVELAPARVVRGQSTEVLVTIERGAGFTDAVDITFSLPEGITAETAVIPANSSDVTVSLSAEPAAQLGPAAMTVSGSAGELDSESEPAVLMIADPPGSLDLSWGGDGIVVIPTNAAPGVARGLTIAPDGSIVVAGDDDLDANASRDWLFVRLSAEDGTELDRNQRLTLGNLYGITAQPDGRILAIGNDINVDTQQFALTRQVASDLGTDSTFGSGGRANYFLEPAYGYDVVVDSTGRIVAGGTGSSDTLVARFDGAGDADLSFGGDGLVRLAELPQDMERIYAVGTDGSDRVYVAGSPFAPFDTYLFRLDASTGATDTSFGPSGIASVATAGAGNEIVYDLALTPSGEIVVVGHSNGLYSVARFTAAGAADAAFSGDGWLTDTIPGTNSAEARAVLVQPDGKIIVVGTGQAPNIAKAMVARYLPDGQLDSAFGASGRVFLFGEAAGQIQMELWAAARQADGRIVAVGGFRGAMDEPDGFAVIRIWD